MGLVNFLIVKAHTTEEEKKISLGYSEEAERRGY